MLYYRPRALSLHEMRPQAGNHDLRLAQIAETQEHETR